MRKKHIFIGLLAILTMTTAHGQKRKAASKKRAVAVEEVKEPSKFDEMLGNTQQIVFIDSVVVNKEDLLKNYKLTAEAGTITGFNHFFRTDTQPYSMVYVNQLNNKCWYARDGRLYTADLLGSEWSEPVELEGLGTFQRMNYPFMLSDGTTLYFSAIGNDGLGGLDVYVSRYDSESGRFLLAENVGLPFNSEANDYMYAIDDLSGIGYFATDRRQPEGKVCIYTFVPNQKRIVYQTDELGEDIVRSRAKINRIADTWGDGQVREEALQRLASLTKAADDKRQQTDIFAFAVNDNIVYGSIADFRDPDNRDRMNELLAMKQRHKALETEIEKARAYYATKAANAEKPTLKTEILSLEHEFYELERNIKILEKMIRNSEIKRIKP